MTIDWGAASTILAGCAAIGAVFLFATKAVVRDELKAMDERFLRKDLAEEKFRQIEEHFDFIRDHKSRAHGAD